jgi:hypothetical protein
MDWYNGSYHRGDAILEVNKVNKRIYDMADAEREMLKLVPVQFGPRIDATRFTNEVEHHDGPLITYTGTPIPLETIKETRKAAVAAKRYEVEVGGASVGGISIPTDREGRKNLRDARDALAEGLLERVDFKTPAGWAAFTSAAQVIPLVATAAQHVQSAFTTEKAHCDAIDALGDVEAVLAYDLSTGWPQSI